MNTRKITLVTADKEISGIVKVSALTLTKLNCQVSIEEAGSFSEAVEKSSPVNIDLIIIDADSKDINAPELIREIRQRSGSKSKKIMVIHSGEINREEIFEAGCDSIMRKDEFKRVINNILVL